MRYALLCIVGLIGLPVSSSASAGPLRGDAPPASYHFVEFRARSSDTVGHTYVVYGTIDRRGRILSSHTAGFYPHGLFSGSVFSAVVPIPGRVESERFDRRYPPRAIYRRPLSAKSYARLVTTVDDLRRSKPTWDLLFFNCNAFAAKVARAIGLRTPSTLILPSDFVRGLYSMNDAPARGARHSRG